MLHETIRNDDFNFSATQRWNIVATLFRMVTTLFQHCNAVLRLKSSLRIVPCNITLTDAKCREGNQIIPSGARFSKDSETFRTRRQILK